MKTSQNLIVFHEDSMQRSPNSAPTAINALQTFRHTLKHANNHLQAFINVLVQENHWYFYIFVWDYYFEAWVNGREIDFDLYKAHLIYVQDQDFAKYIYLMAIFPITFHA